MAFRYSSTAALTCVALASVALAGCDMHNRGPLQARASDEWSRSYTLAAGGELQVVGAVGTISVEGGSGPTIEVRAERVAHAATEAAARTVPAKIRIDEDVTPEKIVLRTEGLAGITVGLEIEVNFRITVPASTRLRLRAAGGDIVVSNVNGVVVASTTNGAITGKGLAGGVDARATNGTVTMELAALSKDPVDLRAVNGQVMLTLPVTADANVDATCTNGAIEVTDLPLQLSGEQTKRRTRGRLNQGGTAVELTTTNGDIHIRGAAAG